MLPAANKPLLRALLIAKMLNRAEIMSQPVAPAFARPRFATTKNAGALASAAHKDPRRESHESGHDFSRANESHKMDRASAPANTAAPRTLFTGLNFALTAGMKVGLVGPNGSGKTTLLRLLRGDIAPAEGVIKRAEALRLVYLSQMRDLDENLTLRRALAPEGDGVNYQGRIVHVASWASRFLFTGEQLNQPVRNLSGGERARVLIAKLMLEPADVLLLDEPTNDLDIPSLEILEDNLLEFPGALVLVTHDRYLLNRVSSVVLGLDGRGSIAQFADFAQWEDWLAEQDSAQTSAQNSIPTPALNSIRKTYKTGTRRADGSLSAKQSQANSASPANSAKKKLSYLEAREFATIEKKVEESDVRLHTAREHVEHPAIASDAAALQQALAELEAAQHESDALYARWAELTEKAEDKCIRVTMQSPLSRRSVRPGTLSGTFVEPFAVSTYTVMIRGCRRNWEKRKNEDQAHFRRRDRSLLQRMRGAILSQELV